jgi:hypothetical protein
LACASSKCISACPVKSGGFWRVFFAAAESTDHGCAPLTALRLLDVLFGGHIGGVAFARRAG